MISTDDDMIDIINNSNPNYNYPESTNSNVNMAADVPPRPASPTHTAFGGRDFIDHEGKNSFSNFSLVCFCCSNWFF